MIELTEEQVRQAFKNAKSDEAKGILTSLFPDVSKEITKKKPTLDDYTSITSYEDACEALGVNPLPNKRLHIFDYDGNFIYQVPKHIVAMMKLETISRALWGRNWKPEPDAEGRKMFYWPWFELCTNKELNEFNDEKKEALLSAVVNDGANDGVIAGFGCLYAFTRYSRSYASIGFHLCQENEEKARYFGGRNFVKLWAEYLQFNFEAGDFIIQQKK